MAFSEETKYLTVAAATGLALSSIFCQYYLLTSPFLCTPRLCDPDSLAMRPCPLLLCVSDSLCASLWQLTEVTVYSFISQSSAAAGFQPAFFPSCFYHYCFQKDVNENDI